MGSSYQKSKKGGNSYGGVLKKKKDMKGLKLTGVDPSRETLALEKDKFPAKNEPPLWKTFWGLRTSAAHLCTDESVVATQMLSSCNANCKMGCSFVHSKTLSLVAKSVKYNCKCKQNLARKQRARENRETTIFNKFY